MDIAKSIEERVDFIKNILKNSGANGIIFGNSGGKDCALVGILSRMATPNVLSVIMPCHAKRNYGEDKDDATALCEKFDIPSITVDLTDTRETMIKNISAELSSSALSNIAPRLRMTTLYAIGQAKGYLVAGTGNACERYMGYFTKWGDGACDFNPIADLKVEEVYDCLRYLGAPENITTKAPSAGLFEGQTDEKEMGVTYKEVADYMDGIEVAEESKKIIERYHRNSEHKRQPIPFFDNNK